MNHDRAAGNHTPTTLADDRETRLASAGQSAAASFPILLTEDQAAALLGVSVRKFAALRHEPWMPKPVKLGPRLLRFVRQEIERAAVDSMPRQQAPGPQPAQLLRGKIDRLKRSGVAA